MVKFYIKWISTAILFFFMLMPAAAHAETLEEQLNNLIGPTEKYSTMLSPVYLRTSAAEESINPQNGELTIAQTDFILPGRNGLNVELKRIYRNNSSNVQEMKVKYVNGAWVDYVYSDAKTASFYEERYNLGIGTRFSIPTMEIRENSDGTSHKFLHTESGDVYRLKAYTDHGELIYLPEGQTVQDVVVKETDAYSNGQDDGKSKYVMAGNDGKKSYFTEDGRLVGIVDRYGNAIRFEYSSFTYTIDGAASTRKLLTSITDTIGRVITLEYKEDEGFTVKPLEGAGAPAESYLASQNPTATDSGDLEGKFQVIAHVPGGQTIVYDKSAVLVSSSKHVMRTRLQRVYDLDGQVKAHLWYEQPDLGFTFMNGSTYSVFNRYENLTQIDYVKTNRIKRYVYNTYTSGLNDKGSMQVRKVFEAKELIKQGYDPSPSGFLERFTTAEKDKTHYAYTNESDGYGIADYQKNDYTYLKDTYRYSSMTTDMKGNTTAYSFDGLHQLLTTEKNGADHKEILTTERDDMKLVKKQEIVQYPMSGGQSSGVPVKRTENYRYDQYGNLTNYTGPEAERDENGNPVDNEHTVVYAYAYDKYHVLTGKTWKTDSGTTAQILYDVDERGNISRETKITGGSGEAAVITEFGYDAYGNMIRKEAFSGTDGQHFITAYSYGTDGDGADTQGAYLTEERVVSASGETVSRRYAYDLNRGAVTGKWDGNGNRISYQYDALGRVLRIVEADGTAKEYAYREKPYQNLEIELTDANGNAFLHQYDILGNLVKKDIREKGVWSFQYAGEYDGKGNKTRETDANGNAVLYEYDSRYRLVSKTFFDAGNVNKGTIRLAYTLTGNSALPLAMTAKDEEGNPKTYYYDALNRLVKLETTADGFRTDVTLFAYDYVGNKVSETDANGHTAFYTYDALGRLTGRKDPAGNEIRQSYNALNQVVKQEEPEGRITESRYDDAGRLAEGRVYQEGQPAAYTYTKYDYDAAGNRIRVRQGQQEAGADRMASDTEYRYDALNRLTDEYRTVDEQTRSHIKVSYDAAGNKTGVVQYADAAETQYRIYEYAYDYAGRVLVETGAYREQSPAGIAEDYGYYRKSYLRDAAGNVLEERDLNAAGEEFVTTYAYDYRNQIVEKNSPFTAGRTKTIRYAYDKTGRRVSESMTVGGVETTVLYAYDGLGRLIGQTDALGNMTRYLYDAAGNRVKQIDPRYGHLPPEQAPGMEYEYDANNRLFRTAAFDGTARTVVGYREYDGRGNIVKEVAGEGYRQEDPRKSVGRLFVYDANNRKISETSAQTAADNAANSTAKVSQRFTYDALGNPLTRTDALGQMTSFAYYGNGLLKSRTDPDGLTETYAYDLTGKAYLAVTNRAGAVTRTRFNIFDKPYRTEYADGTVQTFSYSPKGELLQSVDQNGGITDYGYDASGNMTEKRAWISTEGASRLFKVNRYEYDEANRLVSSETFLETAPASGSRGSLVSAGDRVEHEYDQAGRLIRTSGPNGREVRQEYDRSGKVLVKKTKVTEGTEEVRRYEYDLLLRVTKEILLVPTSDLRMNDVRNPVYDDEYYDRLQSATVYRYDRSGNMTAVTDPNGYTITMNVDLDGKVVKKINPLQASVSYRYDGNGNVMEEKNANGISTFYEYDALSRLIRKSQAADGEAAVTRYVLDAMGNVVKTIAPNQYQAELDQPDTVASMTGISYTYDALNRRTATLSPEGPAMEILQYDGKGQVVKQVDGLRWTGDMSGSAGMEIRYDGLGRPVESKDAMGGTIRMSYDVLDHIVRRTDARGFATAYVYDPDGTLRRVDDPNGGATEYSYDKLGRMLSEKNPLGNVTAYAYNAFGQVKAVTDALGHTMENKTDLAGNLVSASDKRGSAVLFSYDGARRVTEKRTPLERDESGNTVYAVETYRYDPAGNMIRKSLSGSRETDFLRTTAYTYYENGLLHTELDGSGGLTQYAYDKSGNMVKRERLREADRYDTELFEYDGLNRLTRHIRLAEQESLEIDSGLAATPALQDPAYPGMVRLITGYEYDLLGNKVKEIRPLAYAYEEADTVNRELYATRYVYDALNRPVAEIRKHQGADVQVRYSYDASGNRIAVENERGAVTAYAYDGLNRPVSMTDGEGQTLHYAYDLAGNKTQDTNAKGYSMSYRYDGLNRLVEVIDPYGAAVTRYAYDANGNMTKKMDASGILSADTDEARDGWVYEYDLANRLVKETNPELAALHDASWFSASYRYNPAGELVEQTDALGNVTAYAYNEAGLLLSVTDPQQVTTAYSYDLAGNKLTLTDGRGKTTRYTYGALGLLLESVNAAGRKESYRYNLALQMALVQDGNGNQTRYRFDNQERLTGKSVEETGDAIAFTYDETGNRASMTDASGGSVYAYDRNNRLLRVEKDGAPQVAYTYDAIGNVETVTDKLGHVIRYSYDKSSRMETVEAEGKTTSYAYDANGNRASVTYPGGVSETYVYDKAYRLLAMVNKKPDGSVISQYAYTYDENGRQISKTDSYGRTDYAYDESGRVTKVEAPGKTTVYAYDAAGNRQSLQETYTSNQPSGYTEPGSGEQTEYRVKKSEYLYTRDNQLVKLIEQMQDDTGKEVLEKTTEYLYDGNGNEVRQKVSYLHPHTRSLRQSTGGSLYGDGVESDPNAVIEKVSNSFDGFNQLVTTERVKGGERTTIGFVYDGNGLRTQKTVESSANGYEAQVTRYLYDRQYVILETDAADSLSVRYVRGINYISRTGVTGDAAAQPSYFLYNGHGDVVQTVSEDGTVENQYDYDIFGSPTLTIEETYSNAIRYAGEFYDAESGLYYLRARYYNPYTGRFISEDSYWGEDNRPLSLNRYTYVLNSPLMFWDPTGHWEAGDEYLSADDQAKIIALTSAYYSTVSEADRKGIQQEAIAIREQAKNNANYDRDQVTVLQVEAKQTLEYVIDNASEYDDKDFDKAAWDAVLRSANQKAEEYANDHDSTYVSIEYTSSPYTSGLNTGTETTTTIGRTQLLVTTSSNEYENPEVASVSMGKNYLLTPAEELFVGQVLANTDSSVSLDQTVTLLAVMEKNGGTISDPNLEKIFGKDQFVERDSWWKFWNWATGDVLELTYNTSMRSGMSITEIDAQLQSERMQEALGLIGISAAMGPRSTYTAVRNGAVNNGKAKTYKEANFNPCNCFVAGTEVQTDEGEKNIEDIEVGDKVLAKDEKNPDGELDFKEVTGLYRNQRDDIIKLYVGEQVIETTDNHPFWVEGKGWVFADELQAGDKLQKADGSNLIIDNVEFVKLDEKVTVYNFTVADYHTYYVTDIGIWVHNTNCNGVGLTGGNWKYNPNKDVDLRGTGKRYQDALDEAFKRTGVPRDQFNVTKWGKDETGKSIPVEWSGPNGANVNMDIPKWNNVKPDGTLGEGPHQPHIGYQTSGKGANRTRGHIFVDDVPATR
ncbi:polymorphic toxin type 47 domain-containing protein [Paenibacillus sp. YN15]|uniref:polymorphic toxin type 47 domain-containing protein n=1 Tax=Paenibacillus sp. YN15 TaxID=1742774 RepID=UPI000DCBEEE9|nr:polymorphic toxin type 47 domain-containing protein [Paenibacillus sp. YN15]RAV02633.1 hypothetical protein DQG13_08960 [Paenibacillus sp. YN15]